MASTYDFATKGLSILQNPKVLDTLANGYAEVTWRDSLDATTPGLSEALSFKDSASGITSVDQILGDSTLRTVVTTALGIPEQIAFQDIGAQEQAISSRLDITKFQDPKFVESFTTQYLIAAGAAASSSDSDSTSLTNWRTRRGAWWSSGLSPATAPLDPAGGGRGLAGSSRSPRPWPCTAFLPAPRPSAGVFSTPPIRQC